MGGYKKVSTWQYLTGTAAAINHSCRSSVNLKDLSTARALNLSEYVACVLSARSGR